MSERGEIEIRSFGVVFALDRRLHRVDRWRLPLPYGLPLRSIGYAAAAFVAVLVLSAVPLVGMFLGGLPVPVRLALLPAAAAYALTSLKIDGRSAHEACLGVARWWLGPRVLVGPRPGCAPGSIVRFADVVVAPDGRGPRLRRGVVDGPAVAAVRYRAQATERRRSLVVAQIDGEPLDEGFTVQCPAGRRLVIA